ncbi:MAG: type VI secretion system-associated FHA domain protein TagH [Pseudomonadota bacterium]
MPLILRIENVDTLPDGGPVFFELDRRGIDIGRDPYLDWTLPDVERFISGKHCEIHFRDGGYWVHDVSTNGTSVNGQSGRLTEPHRLQNGDRLYIGQYIILAELIGEDGGAGPAIRSSAHTSVNLDPWSGVSDAADAVDKREFSAHARADSGPPVAHGAGDLAEENISWGVEDVISTPATDADVDWTTPTPSASSASDDDFGWAVPSPGAQTADTPPQDWRGNSEVSEAESAATEEAVSPAAEPTPDPVPSADTFDPFADTSSEPAADTDTQPAEDAPGLEDMPVDPFGPTGEAPVDPEPVEASDAPSEAVEPVWGADPAPVVEPAETPATPEPEPEPEPLPEPETAQDPVVAPTPVRSVQPSAPPAPSVPPASVTPQAPSAGDGLASQWADGVQPEQADPEPQPSASAAAQSAGPAGSFVAAFERGAGMPAGSVAGRDDDAFAEELGALFKTVTENLQAMLLARAETKSAMRSSERTMIGALENNPLKFSPTPADAMRVMFGEKTRSYLDAAQTVDQSFGDLQKHQVQTFGAMQQALQALIEDLDPESIAGATSKDGGLAALVSSRRAKFWDTYVERYTAKASRHERGMIDAFMILFAEMYDRQG